MSFPYCVFIGGDGLGLGLGLGLGVGIVLQPCLVFNNVARIAD